MVETEFPGQKGANILFTYFFWRSIMYVGTATWTIPNVEVKSFPLEGSHLERYSEVFNAVEINSSFYKDHMPKSYVKWANMTPIDFKFSVKLNQRFTHKYDLNISSVDLLNNLEGISGLGDKWRVLLLQFPSSQKFYADRMEKFYKTIRSTFDGMVAMEARNLTWAEKESVQLMKEYDILKVIADPEKCPGQKVGRERYYRLHGSPEIYRSAYSESVLENLYEEIKKNPNEVWCIFDNTTFGYATTNALELKNKGDQYERSTSLYGYRAADVYTFDEYREH